MTAKSIKTHIAIIFNDWEREHSAYSGVRVLN